jgi:tyrosyl-tRNA synthetase
LAKRLRGETVWGLTTPLFTNSAGEKMGKTSNGAIWLDDKLLPVWDFWQFWRNIDDSLVKSSLLRFTEIPTGEIVEILQDINKAKIRLATAVTAIVHGEEEARVAEERARDAFTQDCVTETQMLEDGEFSLIDLLLRFNLVKSRNEGRRLIVGRGVKLQSNVVVDPDIRIVKDAGEIRLDIGKKKKISFV